MVALSGPNPRFDEDRARAAAARIRYSEIRDALAQVHVRVQSRRLDLSVDLGVGAMVTAINLTEAAMAVSAATLARELVATINEGVREVAVLTQQLVAPYLSGADIDLAAITSGRLPEPAEAPRKSDLAREIEAASAIPKRPLGSYRPRVEAPDADAGGTHE